MSFVILLVPFVIPFVFIIVFIAAEIYICVGSGMYRNGKQQKKQNKTIELERSEKTIKL